VTVICYITDATSNALPICDYNYHVADIAGSSSVSLHAYR